MRDGARTQCRVEVHSSNWLPPMAGPKGPGLPRQFTSRGFRHPLKKTNCRPGWVSGADQGAGQYTALKSRLVRVTVNREPQRRIQ